MTKKIIKLPSVMGKVGKSRSSIYDGVKQGTFPKPCRLGPRAVGWIDDEIDNWIIEQAELRGVEK